MAVADQIDVLGRDLRSVEKALAVHLAECTAAHRAVDLKIDELQKILEDHAEKTEEYRKGAAEKITSTQKLIMAGIVISALLQGLSSKDALQLVQALLKVYFP